MERQFLTASKEFNTCENHVGAPLFKKVFDFNGKSAKIEIACVGFYKLYVNGKDITKGYLAPYIYNPNDFCYYDEYDVYSLLKEKDNVICVLLGNAFNNSIDFNSWDFEKASFRSAPKFYLGLFDGDKRIVTTDYDFKFINSPITFCDYRCGERYNANLEIDGILTNPELEKGFKKPIYADEPKGEYKKCETDPIKSFEVLKPKTFNVVKDGVVFDFGVNNAGFTKLKINGKKGQVIDLYHVELLEKGEPSFDNLGFWNRPPMEYNQHDVYTCKEGYQEYTPNFTYHGFRYVFVKGLTKEQISLDLLEYVVIHSDIKPKIECNSDNEFLNKLIDITWRSDLSNMHYFPTDCPHREKNGWTGDGEGSSEHVLYSFDAKNTYLEWLNNIVKAQNEKGQFPGIVPTAGWGYVWGNGPYFDKVIVELPLQLYRFYGDVAPIKLVINSVKRYYDYFLTKINEEGLVSYGLCDWLEIGSHSDGTNCSTPLDITDTLTAVEWLYKANYIFNIVNLDGSKFLKTAESLVKAFRKKYILNGEMTVKTQASLSMIIDLKIVYDNEKEKAINDLVNIIKENGNHLKVGFVGIKYLYRVLSDNNLSELMYSMVANETYPSFKNMIKEDTTTLWESFDFPPENIHEVMSSGGRIYSYNHHCWGVIITWIFEKLYGLKILESNKVEIAPELISAINNSHIKYFNGNSSITVDVKKKDGKATLKVLNKGFIGEIKFKGKTFNLKDGENLLEA